MRSRLTLFTFSLYLVLSLSGCTSKPPADNATDTGTGTDAQSTTAKSGKAAERPINVFVPPRAPDDPGPDVTTDSGAGVVEAPVASKRSL